VLPRAASPAGTSTPGGSPIEPGARTARELVRATLRPAHASADRAAVEHCAQTCGEFFGTACQRDLAALGLPSSPRTERAAFLLGALIGLQQGLRARGLLRGTRASSSSWRERLAPLLTAEFELIEGFAPREFSHRAMHSLEALWQDAEGYSDRYRARPPALTLGRLYGRLAAPHAAGPNAPGASLCSSLWVETALEVLCYARGVAWAHRVAGIEGVSGGRGGSRESSRARRGA